jgi:ClpP class serine protease
MAEFIELCLGDSWLMYTPSLMALHSFYRDVMSLKASVGHLKREDIEQLFKQHETTGLSELMHKTPTSELSAMRERGIPIEQTRYARMRNSNIAVLDLIGPIFPRANMMTMSSGVSMEQWGMDFNRVFNSPDVKAVMIHADTPGGDSRGVAAVANMIYQARQKNTKQIEVFTPGFLASAGIYIGAAAHRIIADEWASVGSIGVRVGVANDKGDDVTEFVSDGADLKTADPQSDAGKEYYQARANNMAKLFHRDIAKMRGMTEEAVKATRGAIFLGSEAIKKGLADKVGTFEGTLHALTLARPAGASSTSASEGQETIYVYSETTDELRAIDLASDNEEVDMGLRDKLSARLAALKNSSGQLAGEEEALDVEDTKDTGDTKTGDTTSSTGQPAVVVTAEQVLARRNELTTQFEDSVIDFAERVVMDSKALPAEGIDVAQDMLDAKLDDAIYGGTVSFLDAEGKEVVGTREQKIRAKYERKPKHSMADRRIAALNNGDTQGKILKPDAKDSVDNKDDGPPSQQRQYELLATSTQGRQVLEEKSKSGDELAKTTLRLVKPRR